MHSIRGLLAGALALAVTTSVAVADQDDGIRFKDPLINAYAALAKIEANLGEASAKLYLHAALPASSNERKKLAKELKEDLATIEASAAIVAKSELTGKAAEEFEEFKSGWPEAKKLTEQLTAASAEHPASAKELLAHFEAFDELDNSIDEALEAVAKSANHG